MRPLLLLTILLLTSCLNPSRGLLITTAARKQLDPRFIKTMEQIAHDLTYERVNIVTMHASQHPQTPYALVMSTMTFNMLPKSIRAAEITMQNYAQRIEVLCQRSGLHYLNIERFKMHLYFLTQQNDTRKIYSPCQIALVSSTIFFHNIPRSIDSLHEFDQALFMNR